MRKMNSVTNPLTFRQPSSCTTSGEAEREPLRAPPASQLTFFALGFSRLQFSAPQHAAGPLGESGSQSCANSCHNSRFKYLPLTQPSLQSKQRSKQQAPCRPPAGTLQAGKASSLGPTVDTAIESTRGWQQTATHVTHANCRIQLLASPGPAIAVDTTLVSCLTSPCTRGWSMTRAALHMARRAKARNSPEVIASHRCRLVVLAIETGVAGAKKPLPDSSCLPTPELGQSLCIYGLLRPLPGFSGGPHSSRQLLTRPMQPAGLLHLPVPAWVQC